MRRIKAGKRVGFTRRKIGKLFRNQVTEEFRELIIGAGFPCIGAKAAANSGGVFIAVYEELGSDRSTKVLARDLYAFPRKVAPRRENYSTMVAVFREPTGIAEVDFEKRLWLQLYKLHQEDSVPWNSRVSSDPAAPNFSFSFAGQAYYVVGMHARSSRQARRFRWPTLVFNPHEQFELLRADGNWSRLKQIIRARDIQLQGSINPMLSDFGEKSEARQYSGRAVEDDWRPPFKPANPGKCPFAH
jgi:FPC/CPF motif-containing protein YcgG